MCGIVGYVGRKQALPFLMERLESLSYRGYDSAGVAVFDGLNIQIEKQAGKITELKKALEHRELPGTMGIGHTRWATHGIPNRENAHPLTDCSGRIVVVMNGIIENYLDIKEKLLTNGHKFSSQTDTEVLSHLVEQYYQGDLKAAVAQTLQEVRGSFAVAFISRDEKKIVCSRSHAPLIVGIGTGENYIASDIPALLRDTNKFYVLENGDLVTLGERDIDVDRVDQSKPASRPSITIVDWNPDEVSKGNYPHYMIKEIMEQPRVIENTVLKHLAPEGGIWLPEVNLTDDEIRRLRRIFLVACGTAAHACMYGKQILERALGIPCEFDIASEFRYRNPIMWHDDLLLVVSQSGETADTIASMEEAQRLGVRTLAITNVRGSTIARMADHIMYTQAGPEIAVASTKAFTAQLTALVLLQARFAMACGKLSPQKFGETISNLRHLADWVREVLKLEDRFKEIGEKIAKSEHCYYLGRNLDEPITREGALKLKEISYIHAEAYPAGELKHGTIALLEEGTPIVAVITQDSIYEKMISNIQEVIARKAHVFALTIGTDTCQLEKFSEVVKLPECPEILRPIIAVVPLQLIAYYAAIARGTDVDQPRNLAKSVTVE